MTTVPLAFFWGDDELSAARAVDRFEAALAAEGGAPLERWVLRGNRNTASGQLADLNERVATPVMFGGGTLAVVHNAGALVVKTEDRDAFLAALDLVAPGNAVVILEASRSGAKAPVPKRLAEAIRAAGGDVRPFVAPRQGRTRGWIEARARERRIAVGPGAARSLRPAWAGSCARVTSSASSRAGSRRWSWRSSRCHVGPGPITVGDVQDLVAEAVPGSVWAFVDAVGQRRRGRALELLERLIEDKPAPVLLAVLHRRLRELIEVQDRLERGESPGSLVRSMRLQPFRAETLAGQARAWTGPELDAALDGLVELDAQVKGVGGRASTEARDRLSFDLWITDRVATG